MSAPIAFLDARKFLENLSRYSSFDSTHDVRSTNIGRSRYQNMNMIFTDDTMQNMSVKTLTGLTYKITNSHCKLTLQNVLAVFCDPNKMVLYLKFCVTSPTIFHVAEYNPSASKMLPT